MRAGLADARHLVDVKRVPGLASVWEAGGGVLRLGAAATHDRVARSPQVRALLPALEEAGREVGNVRVRCTGTIGGNLCFAEPNSDPAAVLVAHGASLTLESVRGGRRITLDEFLLGPLETAREPDEILTHVDVPLLPRHGAAYVRFMTTEERPIATAAAVLRADGDALADVRIVVGATGPRPARLPESEAAASELAPDVPDEQVRELGRLAGREADVASDRNGPEDYKRHVVGLLVARAVEVARARARAAAPGAP